MKRTLLPLSLLLILLAASATAQTDAPAKDVDPAEWVPADALFFLGITDVERVWEDFKKTASYALLSDKSLGEKAPQLGLFVQAREKLQERLAKALDVPKEQLRNPLRGPLALYALGDPAKPGELEPGLVATVGDAATMRKYYDAAVRKLKDVGTYEAVSFGPDTIDVFTSKSEGADELKKGDDQDPDFDAGESPLELLAGGPEKAVEQALDELFSADTMPPKLALCLTPERLIVAGSVDQVKASLKREKPGKSLAETDDYKALLRHLKPVGPVRFLCNVPRVIEMGKAASQGDEELGTMLKVIGAESLRSLVGHMRFGAAAYDGKFELLLLMNSDRAGLAKILSMENRPTAPPAAIGADAVMFFGVNLQPAKLYEDIERMVRQTDAQAADQMRQAVEAMPMPGGQPVNLLKDFIDHLRGPLTMSLAFARPVNADAVRFVLSLGHKDQPAMTKFFSSFVGMLQPRDLRGTQVFDMPMLQMTLAATSDRLVLGNTSAVESALEAKAGDPLAESDAWKKVARLVPEQSWLTVYVDSRRMTEAAIDLAKAGDSMGGGGFSGGLMSGFLSGMSAGQDAADPDVMRKMLPYQAVNVMTITTTPEGVQFTSVTLKPEK